MLRYHINLEIIWLPCAIRRHVKQNSKSVWPRICDFSIFWKSSVGTVHSTDRLNRTAHTSLFPCYYLDSTWNSQTLHIYNHSHSLCVLACMYIILCIRSLCTDTYKFDEWRIRHCSKNTQMIEFSRWYRACDAQSLAYICVGG